MTNIATVQKSVTNGEPVGRIAEKLGPAALKGRKRRFVQVAIYRMLNISDEIFVSRLRVTNRDQ